MSTAGLAASRIAVPGGGRAAALLALTLIMALTGAPARAADYDWVLVTKTNPPAQMHPGESRVLSVVLRNTGTEAWHGEELGRPFRLATTGGRKSAFASMDATWLWSGGTRIRMTSPEVLPGREAVFTFTFTAPVLQAYPQSFDERFVPVAEGAWASVADISFATQVRLQNAAIPPYPGTGAPPPPCTTATAGYGDLFPASAAHGYEAGEVSPVALASPRGVALDTLGNVVVADTGNDRIRRLQPNGLVLKSWDGTGTAAGKMRAPEGVTVGPTGIVFVADTGNDRILLFSLTGLHIGGFGTTGGGPGEFRSPSSVSFITGGPLAGNLLISDRGNSRIQVVSQTGTPVASIGSPGTDPGMLNGPSAAAAYGDHIYVADTGNHRVARFTHDGSPAGSWGGAAEAERCFRSPAGIAVNRYGVYVSDTGGDRMTRFTRSGHALETWSSVGSAPGQIDAPAGLAVEAGGSVWVAETGGNRLQRFAPRFQASPLLPCGDDPVACAPLP